MIMLTIMMMIIVMMTMEIKGGQGMPTFDDASVDDGNGDKY